LGKNLSYMCHVCGKSHDDVPTSFAADYPDMYANMSQEERNARAILGSDQCIIDDTWFFLRGCLEIPIIGQDQPFLWGLWALIKEEVFNEISDCWEEEGREQRHGPFKGRIANLLKAHPDSFNTKIRIILQPVGARPLFIVEEPESSMALAQASGLSQGEARELAARHLHDVQDGPNTPTEKGLQPPE
jgi:hypothetical protein